MKRKNIYNFGKHSKKLRWDRIVLVLCIVLLITTFKLLHNEIQNKNNITAECNTQTEDLHNKLNEANTKLEESNNKVTELESNVETLQTKLNALEEKQKTSTTSRGGTLSRKSTNVESKENDSTYKAFVATGYCSCSKCCGKATGRTASGTKATANRTVAMPSSYSFGTKIEIKGMGTYVVEDRGGAIKGNKIDIYFNTHQEALNFGRRTVYLKTI